MRQLQRIGALLRALTWSVIAVVAYAASFTLRLLGAILLMLTIMMASADRSARNNHRRGL